MNIHRYLVKNSKRRFVTDNTYQLQIFPLAQLKSKPFNVNVYNAKNHLSILAIKMVTIFLCNFTFVQYLKANFSQIS